MCYESWKVFPPPFIRINKVYYVQKYLKEARTLLALGIPVIIAQFTQTAMGVVDTVMAGRVGATDMSAVAVGTSIWLPAILFGHGLLMALTPVVAQLNGSGRRPLIANQIRQGMWLAAFLSVLVIAVLYNSRYIIENMPHIDPVLAEKAVGFTHAIMWGHQVTCFIRCCAASVKDCRKPNQGW